MYNEDNSYGYDERFSNRRPPRGDFRDRPKPEVKVKLNGPHLCYENRDFDCQGDCGKMVAAGDPFYYVNLLGDDRPKRMCPDCTRKQII